MDLQTYQSAVPNWTPPRVVFPGTTKKLASLVISIGEAICDLQLYRYQRLFSLAIVMSVLRADGQELTALFSRQSGKTEAVAVTAIALAVALPALAYAFPDDERVSGFRSGFRIGIYGPKERQAKISFDRIRKYASTDRAEMIYADADIDIELQTSRGDSLAWSNGSYILSETASDNTDNEGQTWDLVVIDEAQKLSSHKITKELSPTLASTNGPLVMIGTATSHKGYYFKTIERNKDVEKQTGARSHFQYEYDKVLAEKKHRYEKEAARYRKFVAATPQKQHRLLLDDPAANTPPNPFHLKYSKFIDRELARVRGDLDDPEFRQNFRLKWDDNTTIAVPQKVWDAAALPEYEMNQEGEEGFIVAGLDIAKGDKERADQSVLTVMRVDVSNPIVDKYSLPTDSKTPANPVLHFKKTVIGVYSFYGSFEYVQYGRIMECIRKYPTLRYLLCDSTGMGDPVTERLQVLLHWITVEGVVLSLYGKSNIYKRFLEEMKAGRLFYGAGPATRDTKEFEEMSEQVTSLHREGLSSGAIRCMAPDGEHDDYPDSMALATQAAHDAVELMIREPGIAEVTSHTRGTASSRFSDSNARANRYRSGRMNSVRGRRQAA